MSKLQRTSDGIKIEGHRGTWYVIDDAIYNGDTIYLLEHETYGDEAANVIVNSDGELLLEDVWNGFLDFEEAFEVELEY